MSDYDVGNAWLSTSPTVDAGAVASSTTTASVRSLFGMGPKSVLLLGLVGFFLWYVAGRK